MSTIDHGGTEGIYTTRTTDIDAAAININNKTHSQLRIDESGDCSQSYDRFSTTTNFTTPASNRHTDDTDGIKTTTTTADGSATLNTTTETQLHFRIAESANSSNSYTWFSNNNDYTALCSVCCCTK